MGGGITDVGAFLIEHFSNPDQLMHRLRLHNLPCPKYDTAVKWFQRQSIPGEWAILLVHLLVIESAGKINLSKFIKKAKEDDE